MATARKLLYDFDREFARFNTASSKVLSIVDKFAILNKAQKILFEDRAKKAELNAHIREELRPFEIKETKLGFKRSGEKYDVYKEPEDMFKPLRRRVIATKESCGTKEIPITVFQTDDIDRGRNNPFWKSDFRWEQVIGDEGADGFFVWHEDDFEIDEVVIDYYRWPKEIHGPSLKKPQERYMDWNGKIQTEDQGSEMDQVFSDIRIVNLAVLIARATTSDFNDYQIKQREILDTDQLSAI